MKWERIPLSELSEVVTKGTTPTTIGRTYVSSGIPFLRAQNINGSNVILNNDILFIDDETNNLLARSQIISNDILLSIAGTIGRSAVVPNNSSRLNCNQAVAIIRPKAKIIFPYFLKYWLDTKDAQNQIYGAKVTATISNLSLSQIKQLKIPFPPIEEQKRIAAILDKADSIRRKREKAIELADVFLKSVFLDMFGDPVTNPKGWETSPFKNLIKKKLCNGLSPSKSGSVEAEVLTLSAITGNIFDPGCSKIASFLSEIPNSKYIDNNIFLICRGNGNLNLVGRGKRALGIKAKIVFPDTMIAAEIDDTMILTEFLTALWDHKYIRMQVERSARTTNGTYKINQKSLESIEVIVPPIDSQKQFSSIYKKSMEAVFKMRKFTKNALFNSLSQRAFRGDL